MYDRLMNENRKNKKYIRNIFKKKIFTKILNKRSLQNFFYTNTILCCMFDTIFCGVELAPCKRV